MPKRIRANAGQSVQKGKVICRQIDMFEPIRLLPA
jgi:hypothetical protein